MWVSGHGQGAVVHGNRANALVLNQNMVSKVWLITAPRGEAFRHLALRQKVTVMKQHAWLTWLPTHASTARWDQLSVYVPLSQEKRQRTCHPPVPAPEWEQKGVWSLSVGLPTNPFPDVTLSSYTNHHTTTHTLPPARSINVKPRSTMADLMSRLLPALMPGPLISIGTRVLWSYTCVLWLGIRNSPRE